MVFISMFSKGSCAKVNVKINVKIMKDIQGHT